MKVIERGQDGPLRLWVGRCKDCNSLIEAEQAEISHFADSPNLAIESCPVCGDGSKFNRTLHLRPVGAALENENH